MSPAEHPSRTSLRVTAAVGVAALALGIWIGFLLGQSTAQVAGPASPGRAHVADRPAASGAFTTPAGLRRPAHAEPAAVAELEGEVFDAEDEGTPSLPDARWRLGEELPLALEPWRAEYRQPVDPLEFELKYDGWELEALDARHDQLRVHLRETRRSVHLERYADGAGTYLRRAADMEVDNDGDGMPDPELGFKIAMRNGEPWTMATGHVLPGGESVVDVTWMPFDEYPELYALDDEKNWLKQKITQLEAQSGD
ncbi:hypothetical protein [Engelhardtia mirabilis]|uniref:Uncharacterized protein n=1 Tax=Engelhardtia mirabilis TaxID=2528011 RepID=A0A518BM14_9BACT|nr:hypothetical protein Pla133_30940 [Planctomycetes bacterium Pla133]QDV02329.1 hypothetical protein Pla86_30930 [Planctomycetes bacterium Pla86]